MADQDASKPGDGAEQAPQTDAVSTARADAETPADPSLSASAPTADAARVAELEAEVAALRDQLMRAAADLQNARKRADRERKDAETYGGAKLARDLLSVFDNLEAAVKLASAELQESEPGFFNGVSLTQKELLNVFAKHGVTPVTPEFGEKFDPNRHQAMFEAPAPGAPAGSVMQVMQSGFMIGERLLRPAMVGVAAAGSEPAGAEPDAAEKSETEPTAS